MLRFLQDFFSILGVAQLPEAESLGPVMASGISAPRKMLRKLSMTPEIVLSQYSVAESRYSIISLLTTRA